MSQVLLAGAGRFAEEITDLAADAGVTVMGWIEGIEPTRADPAHSPPIVWVGDQKDFLPELPVAPAIGSVARRGLVERLQSEGRELATLVHPSAVVARSATLEPGCVLFPQVVVGARARIGTGTILNRGALVGHHTTIGPHSFLGPGANVAGGVRLGEQVQVALAAVVRDDIEVGDRAIVGAGAVAVRSVPADVTVVGVPARVVARDR
jgi:sugar O-acyltransferase (sialic acid O-acetyltransferase NeuD family)